MANYPNYNYNMPKTDVAGGLVAFEIVAAVALTALGSRVGLMIINPSTNTGNLYFNLSTTNPTIVAGGYQFKLTPGQWFVDESSEVYQGEINGIMDGPGAEGVDLYLGAKPS